MSIVQLKHLTWNDTYLGKTTCQVSSDVQPTKDRAMPWNGVCACLMACVRCSQGAIPISAWKIWSISYNILCISSIVYTHITYICIHVHKILIYIYIHTCILIHSTFTYYNNAIIQYWIYPIECMDILSTCSDIRYSSHSTFIY